MDLTASEWRGYRRGDFPVGSWVAEGEALRAIGTATPVDLVSRRRFRNFALSFEWRLPPGGNSGVLYRVSEDLPASWQSGPELQLLDDARHPDGRNPLTACGALYDLLAPLRLTPPSNAFISARLLVRERQVEHWLNNVQVLVYDLGDPHLQERIAASKFTDHPRFGKEAEGHLVLQHHGSDAWFRHIRVEPI